MPVSRILFVMLGLATVCALGCTGPSPPDPSDPAAGRELLQKSLDAWKRGESHDAYRQSASNVTVIEQAWKSGTQLIDFEIAGDPSISGYDVLFKVTLTLQDRGGTPRKQKALYNVCTTPKLVVSRSEGSW